jgi:hypothetical protein
VNESSLIRVVDDGWSFIHAFIIIRACFVTSAILQLCTCGREIVPMPLSLSRALMEHVLCILAEGTKVKSLQYLLIKQNQQ